MQKIDNFEDRGRQILEFLGESLCLKKYAQDQMSQCAHSFMRIVLTVLERGDPQVLTLLEEAKFGFFYSSLVQRQYSVLQLLIETRVENIHVISRYVEESNIRLRTFEAILNSDSQILKNELLNSQFIQKIVSSLLVSNSIFDVSYYRSNYKFLPFRNFQPFRSEAICLISVIFWKNQSKNTDTGN